MSVQERATEILSDPRAVIFDTETTGLRGHVVEIAAIDMSGHVLLNMLVKPPVPVEDGARRVHGISDAELLPAPKFAVAWNDSIYHCFLGRHLWAYNVEFDKGVLERDIARAWPGKTQEVLESLGPESSWGCLMDLRTEFNGFRKKLRGGDHRAYGDCLAALKMLRCLAEGYDPD